jgi:hypothetical protein
VRLWLHSLGCLLQGFVKQTQYVVIMCVNVFQDGGETIGKGTVFLGSFQFVYKVILPFRDVAHVLPEVDEQICTGVPPTLVHLDKDLSTGHALEEEPEFGGRSPFRRCVPRIQILMQDSPRGPRAVCFIDNYKVRQDPKE